MIRLFDGVLPADKVRLHLRRFVCGLLYILYYFRYFFKGVFQNGTQKSYTFINYIKIIAFL